MPAEIFVSYSRADRERVLEITSRLTAQGVSVWIDLEGISAASRWSAEIVHALEQCRLLLLMVSATSVDSTYVRQEVLLAAESGKALLPLYLDPVRLPPEFRLHFAGIQNLELERLGPEDAAKEILRALKRIGDPSPHPQPGGHQIWGGHGQPYSPNLPRGTVTIVFTDIEGSSDLWEARRHELLPLYERHNEIVREQLPQFHGLEVKTTGDGFMLAFDRAIDAVDFGCALQERLAEEDWTAFDLGVSSLKVRVGAHTGEVIVADDGGEIDYYGPVPNRAARVCGAAQGAQVLASQSTWTLAAPEAAGRLHARDLGPHFLKGVGEERLWQISRDPADLQALPTAPPKPSRAKLPKSATTFVGRKLELERFTERLRARKSRVYTLLGPGGTGKSRLALELATRLSGDFADGAIWVDLVEAVDGEGMWQRIATAIGLEPKPQQSLSEQVTASLSERDLLLVLDNTEQIQRDGGDLCGAVLKTLVQATGKLVLLVVTRRAPTLAAQQRLEVGPLSPEDATSLFVERAQAIQDDATLESLHPASVAKLCQRLEYIPLAIELAAARVDLLSPQEILRRLERGPASWNQQTTTSPNGSARSGRPSSGRFSCFPPAFRKPSADSQPSQAASPIRP